MVKKAFSVTNIHIEKNYEKPMVLSINISKLEEER